MIFYSKQVGKMQSGESGEMCSIPCVSNWVLSLMTCYGVILKLKDLPQFLNIFVIITPFGQLSEGSTWYLRYWVHDSFRAQGT